MSLFYLGLCSKAEPGPEISSAEISNGWIATGLRAFALQGARDDRSGVLGGGGLEAGGDFLPEGVGADDFDIGAEF